MRKYWLVYKGPDERYGSMKPDGHDGIHQGYEATEIRMMMWRYEINRHDWDIYLETDEHHHWQNTMPVYEFEHIHDEISQAMPNLTLSIGGYGPRHLSGIKSVWNEGDRLYGRLANGDVVSLYHLYEFRGVRGD